MPVPITTITVQFIVVMRPSEKRTALISGKLMGIKNATAATAPDVVRHAMVTDMYQTA